MRKITEIIIHCSATEENADYSAFDINCWHKAQGWSKIGYHYVVRLDGTVERGRPESEVGAHCKGHNQHSIGVCYIGGLRNGKPADTRTAQQKSALKALIAQLRTRYPNARVIGHRDTGAKKECPCFNAKAEYITIFILALTLMFLASCRTKTQCIQTASLDSLSLHQKDSVGTKLDFSFDRLIITTLDQFTIPTLDQQSSTVTPSRPNGRAGHGVRGSSIIIENGMLATTSDSKTSTDTDLKSAKVEKKQVHIRSQPNHLSVIFFIVLFVFIFIIYKKCSSR